MIVNTFLNILYGIISALIFFLPSTNGVLPEIFDTAWNFLASVIGSILYLFPDVVSNDILFVLHIAFWIESFIILFWLADKIYTWLRG